MKQRQLKNKFFGICLADVNPALVDKRVYLGQLFWLDKQSVISSGPSISIILGSWMFRFVWFTHIERL